MIKFKISCLSDFLRYICHSGKHIQSEKLSGHIYKSILSDMTHIYSLKFLKHFLTGYFADVCWILDLTVIGILFKI